MDWGRDANIVLEDGRVFEYWEGGNPGGRTVIFQPGTPATRRLGRWGHDAAIAAGVRLIAVNRPGYGGSTSIVDLPGGLRTVGRDTVSLVNSLGIDEFAVFGSSGGGPFAVATAVAAPTRVRALGIVGGVGPWRELDISTEDLAKNSDDRACLAMLDEGDAAGAWACLNKTVEEHRNGLTPSQFVDAVFAGDSSGLVNDPAYRKLWVENVRDVQANTDGYTFDNVAWGGAWDVDPRAVAAPTLLLYGSVDPHCPADRHGRWYAERISGSQLVVVPSAGHIDVIDSHWPEVLAALLAMWGPPR